MLRAAVEAAPYKKVMKKPSFISHSDFASLAPVAVFAKEHTPLPYSHPEQLQNKHILYRRTFTAPAFANAALQITADDFYKLYINGSYVAEGPTPSYPHAYYYHTIDVTPYLQEGQNTLAVHTYYQGLRNRVWVSGDLRQMLWCTLALDGKTVLVSDGDWKCAYHSGYSACGRLGYDTGFAECYNSAAPEAGFETNDFDDSGWDNALPNTRGGWSLIPQPTPPVEIERLEPSAIDSGEGWMTLTFPTEAAGNLTAVAKGKPGDRVVLFYGEELNADGSVRYEMRCNCRYREEWILSGGEDVLKLYDYKAFRYAELRFPAGVEITKVALLARHAPFTRRYTYPTADPRLQKVLDLCANTVRYGTMEQFIDCPTREKGAYLGDMMVSGRAHAILTGDATLLKQAAENFARSAFICPGLMAVAGASHMQEIADYSLEFPALLTWIYAFDSDIDFLRRMEPAATALYRYFAAFENADGLLSGVDKWNLVDWPANLRDGYDFPLENPIGPGLHNVINALWYGLKLALGEIYSILGISAELGARRTRASFIRTFYRPESGLFADSRGSDHCAVHSQVFPLLFGIADGKEIPRQPLVDAIAAAGLPSMGVYMAYFALCALRQAGEDALCLTLATSPDAWLNMIAQGATVTFEAWGKEQKWNTSLFHPWAVAPAAVFYVGRWY